MRYVAISDDRTRDEHIDLNGTVASVDDDFWNTFYPPNGWNCRCDVELLTAEEGARKSLQPKPSIPIDEDFKKNTGKELNMFGNWLSRQQIETFTPEQLALINQAQYPNNPEPSQKNIEEAIIEDYEGVPVSLADASREQLTYIDDILADPQEVWSEQNTTSYLKKYDKWYYVEIKNGAVNKFAQSDVNKKRKGILHFAKTD